MVMTLYSKNLEKKNKFKTPIKVSIPFINDLSLSYVTNQNSIIPTTMVNHDKNYHKVLKLFRNPKTKIFEIKSIETNKNSNIQKTSLKFKKKSSYKFFKIYILKYAGLS